MNEDASGFLERVSRTPKAWLLSFLQGMERSITLQRVVVGVVIALIFAAALYLRIRFSYEVVYGGDIVRYTGVDAYWHMRIVDNLAHNFPHLNSFDPYMIYPGGSGTSSSFPFFDYLLAGIIWIIGLGSPTQHTVDMIGPYYPPVLGALTVIPVYFIGKTLFSRWAGVIGAGLVAILPGEFLGRSILGFADHHVAETLFSTTAMMFALLALKNVKKEQITWSQLRHPKGTGLIKPAVYGMLGGVFLGLYLASWQGALLFILILAAFLLVQFSIDHLKKTPTDYLCLAGAVMFLSAFVTFLVFSRHGNTLAILAMATAIPLALFAISRLMATAKLKPFYYPAALLVLGVAGFFILRYAVAPSLVKQMLVNFDIFKWNTGTTISEVIPSLYQRSSAGQLELSLTPLWQVYGFALLFSIAGLGTLLYTVTKRWEPERVLLIIWTLIILLATLGQRRFNYYFVVNVAVFTGYSCWGLLRLAGLRDLARIRRDALRDQRQLPKSKRRKQPKDQPFRLRGSHAYVALTAIVIFSLFTIIPYTKADLASTGSESWVSVTDFSKATAELRPEAPRYAPPDAWCESLTWLRDHSPEPFGDPDFYYSRYDGSFDYSDYPDAYGVIAWWDYGYWIMRIGHRPPSQNPGGAIPDVAEFFLAQSESDAQRILDARGARYVILDYQFVAGKFYGAVSITGRSEEEFYDDFFVQYKDDQGQPAQSFVRLYFPEYYRSMSVRLYTFGGKAVTPGPDECMVISWELDQEDGVEFKRVTSTQTFDTYEAAVAWMAGHNTSGNYQIVSSNPFVSPVPLEELTLFTLCRDSNATTGSRPQVRIFEYVG